MQNWWPVGMSLVLVAVTIALQALRYGYNRAIHRIMDGAPIPVVSEANSDKRYALVVSSIVIIFSMVYLPVDDALLARPFVANIIIGLAVVIYWLRQPNTVEVFRPSYPD